MRSSLVPILVLLVFGRVCAENGKEAIWKGFSVSCVNDDSGQVVGNSSISCHGIRLVRKIVQKLLQKNKNIEFLNGVSLVDGDDNGGGQLSEDARFFKDYGFMGTFVKWLESRELRIKLPNLLPVNLKNAIEQSLPSSDFEGRGKEGNGFGGNQGMLMAMMMGKMMAAMGFGALGLLAMKALALSAAALMLSLLAATKKMDSKDEEKHVVYAQEIKHGHYRRRRSLENDNNHPYRGYIVLPNDASKM